MNLSFFERQHIDCLEREKKRKRREEENSAKSLRRQMHPRLNQSTSESLERQSAELGRGLYEAGKKSVQQIAQRREAYEKSLHSQMNSQKALATSKKLIEDRTDLKLTEIFELLDSDGDGVISAKRIAIEALEADHCRILGPYLLQLEEVPNSSMDLEQFKMLMQYAFKVPTAHQKISIEEKRTVLGMNEKKAQPLPPSFQVPADDQPRICEKSRLLAAHKPRIYEQDPRRPLHKCELPPKEDSLNSECVFKPKINLYRAPASAYCK